MYIGFIILWWSRLGSTVQYIYTVSVNKSIAAGSEKPVEDTAQLPTDACYFMSVCAADKHRDSPSPIFNHNKYNFEGKRRLILPHVPSFLEA